MISSFPVSEPFAFPFSFAFPLSFAFPFWSMQPDQVGKGLLLHQDPAFCLLMMGTAKSVSFSGCSESLLGVASQLVLYRLEDAQQDSDFRP